MINGNTAYIHVLQAVVSECVIVEQNYGTSLFLFYYMLTHLKYVQIGFLYTWA